MTDVELFLRRFDILLCCSGARLRWCWQPGTIRSALISIRVNERSGSRPVLLAAVTLRKQKETNTLKTLRCVCYCTAANIKLTFFSTIKGALWEDDV